MSAAQQVRLVREALEGVLSAPMTSTVLFEALEAQGGIPQGTDALRAFVAGPLRAALARHAGPPATDEIVARVLTLLGGRVRETDYPEVIIEEGATSSELPPGPGARLGSLDDTTAVPLGRGAVPVLVLAGSSDFATRIEVSLGPERVAPSTLRDLRRIERILRKDPPAVVLVDGADLPDLEPDAVVACLGAAPTTTPVVVWAAELPYGRLLASALDAAALAHVALRRAEGIEPLLDLIRSRRGG